MNDKSIPEQVRDLMAEGRSYREIEVLLNIPYWEVCKHGDQAVADEVMVENL